MEFQFRGSNSTDLEGISAVEATAYIQAADEDQIPVIILETFVINQFKMAELTKAELKLYVYGGDINDVPETPQYTLSKTMLSGDTAITFEISELIKDYVEIKFDGNYEGIEQTKWVYYEVTRTYDDDTTDSFNEHGIAFRGFGSITDGINPELTKKVMMSNTVVNNYCGYPISIPYYTGDTGTKKIEYKQDTTSLKVEGQGNASLYTIDQTTRLNPTASDVVTIDKTASVAVNSDSSSGVEEIPLDANSVTFTFEDGTTRTIKVECIDECRNTPHRISFINKYGAMRDMWFFARRKDSPFLPRESNIRKQYLIWVVVMLLTVLETTKGFILRIKAEK